MAAHLYPITVRFADCDPAGIVFYPRYFEMINETVEDWFDKGLGHSFADIIAARTGIPLGEISCQFLRPSRLGDKLRFSLSVTRIAGSRIGVAIVASCGQEERLRAQLTLVHVRDEGVRFRGTALPPSLRRKIEVYQQDGLQPAAQEQEQ